MKISIKKRHYLTVVEDDLLSLLRELSCYDIDHDLYVKKIRNKDDALTNGYEALWAVSVFANDDQWSALVHMLEVLKIKFKIRK